MVQARIVAALALLLVLSSAVTLALYFKVSKISEAPRLTITRSKYDQRERKLFMIVESEGGSCKLKALIVNCNGSITSIPLHVMVKNSTSFYVKVNLSKGCLISVVTESGMWVSFREEG